MIYDKNARRIIGALVATAGLIGLGAIGLNRQLVHESEQRKSAQADIPGLVQIDQRAQSNILPYLGGSIEDLEKATPAKLYNLAEQAEQNVYRIKEDVKGARAWLNVAIYTREALDLYNRVITLNPDSKLAQKARTKAESLYLDALLSNMREGDVLKVGDYTLKMLENSGVLIHKRENNAIIHQKVKLGLSGPDIIGPSYTTLSLPRRDYSLFGNKEKGLEPILKE